MPFSAIFDNPVVITGFFAWILAQLSKLPVEYIRKREWNWGLLASAGGMPSSHSSLMTAVAFSIGHYYGFDQPVFALALAITGIVVYDATGVRRQAGLQAQRINLIIKDFFSHMTLPEKEFKDLREMIGHSWGEALGGIVFGLLVSVIVWVLIPLPPG